MPDWYTKDECLSAEHLEFVLSIGFVCVGPNLFRLGDRWVRAAIDIGRIWWWFHSNHKGDNPPERGWKLDCFNRDLSAFAFVFNERVTRKCPGGKLKINHYIKTTKKTRVVRDVLFYPAPKRLNLDEEASRIIEEYARTRDGAVREVMLDKCEDLI